ncbi:hypothetical protein RDI58_004309 [Solanum bulbocastanum]|uniref:Uncharacterized protein n=1 Tax=Solanum bulbocastanum TaxID=147425 RepID=A0AAN8TXI3_SOLBU
MTIYSLLPIIGTMSIFLLLDMSLMFIVFDPSIIG